MKYVDGGEQDRRPGGTNRVSCPGPMETGVGTQFGPHYIVCIERIALSYIFFPGPLKAASGPAWVSSWYERTPKAPLQRWHVIYFACTVTGLTSMAAIIALPSNGDTLGF